METLLSDQELSEVLKTLNIAWSALPGQGLVRVFKTGNFATGVALIERLADAAEVLDHHPDILLTYDQVTVTLLSHEVGGITGKDVALARAIDALDI